MTAYRDERASLAARVAELESEVARGLARRRAAPTRLVWAWKGAASWSAQVWIPTQTVLFALFLAGGPATADVLIGAAATLASIALQVRVGFLKRVPR